MYMTVLSGCSALDRGASHTAAGWIDIADATAHVLGKGRKRRNVPVGRAALQAVAAWLDLRRQIAAPNDSALLVSRVARACRPTSCAPA